MAFGAIHDHRNTVTFIISIFLGIVVHPIVIKPIIVDVHAVEALIIPEHTFLEVTINAIQLLAEGVGITVPFFHLLDFALHLFEQFLSISGLLCRGRNHAAHGNYK